MAIDDKDNHQPATIRLAGDRILEAVPGDLIWRPEGHLVELVRCHPETGYWFWYRVDEDTLSRQGGLAGGPWTEHDRGDVPVDQWAARELELLSANHKRRESVISQLQELHREMALINEISNVLYANILDTGRKLKL